MPTIYDDKPTVVVGAVGTASVACLTAFSIDRLARRLFAKKGSGGGLTIYEDEDGIATEESQHDASSWFQKAIVALMVLSGFGVSLASAILETAGGNGNGIALGIALSSTCLIAVICAEILFFNHPGGPLTLAQLSAASVCLLTAILIPRRPDVFRDGKVVEGEKSTSWLGRMTFAWADKVLDYATQHQTLTLEELPALHKEMQSQTLLDSFEQRRKSQPHARLWRLLLNGYWRVFAQMAVQTLIASIVSFAPSVALLVGPRLHINAVR
ncbi:hypothetical protein KEM55_006778 [Ascosphaera atra]|nr:hypothetical protein KEM55_006778 [Ascosphaera atra]